MDKLFQDGILLDISIHFWSFQKSLRPEDLKLEKRDIPNIFTLGRKFLFSKEVRNSFASLRTLTDYYVDKYSFAFPVGGVRYVPYKALPVVLENLRRLQKDFLTAVNTFVANYDVERDKMLKEYSKYAFALAGFYPPPQEIADKFSFDWVVFELGHARPITDKKLIKELNERKILEEEAQAYQTKLASKVNSFLDDVVISLREEAAKLCQTIVNKLDAKEIVSQKSVNALKELIDRFSTINFMDDKTLDTSLQELRDKLINVNNVKKSPALQEIIKDGANKIIEAAKDITDASRVSDIYKKRMLKI